jgi:hypothetical protein
VRRDDVVAQRWEELRDGAAGVWNMLDELLIFAEANGDEAVLAPLLAAMTMVQRVERMGTARERWKHARRPLTGDELADVLASLDEALPLARRLWSSKAAALLVTARARVAEVAELVTAAQA